MTTNTVLISSAERIVDDNESGFDLVGGKLATTCGHVDFTLIADYAGDRAANATDAGERLHHLLAPIDVGISATGTVSARRPHCGHTCEPHFETLAAQNC